MGQKLVKIVLVFSMLFSTVGVSAASIACKQKQRMATASCTKCKSTTPKSCCKTVYKHLGLKSEYHRPAADKVDAASALVLAVLCDGIPQLASQHARPQVQIAGPPIALGSLDRCSLISAFRI